MAILPFGAYRPDVSDYEGEATQTVMNVVPRADGYGPFPALSAYTGALPAPCRGHYYARNADGTISVFAGTSTKLYKINNTTLAWDDVSKGSSTYSALSADAQWEFVQFNNYLLATQVNAPLQYYDLTSSSTFDDLSTLGDTPPQAAYIAVVNRFVVLTGLASPDVYRIQWSALNDITGWTPGLASSDFQDLADGGIVRGVSGGEDGIIFQDASIRRMLYAPGSPYVFGIERISLDDGMFAPYSLIRAGDRLFWCSPQGFKYLVPGGYPTPIGKEKVDRTFFADVDTDNLQLFMGAQDPKLTRVFWAYKSINGTSGQFDKILCYDWVLDKWATITASGQFLCSLAKPGITLEGVDTAFGSNIDTLTIESLDSISNASLSALSAFDTSNKLGFFTGANLEATAVTPEKGGDGRRFFVRGARVVTDAPTVYISIGAREGAQTAPVYSTETEIDSTGWAPQRVSTRFARGKMRIPSGTSWTFAAGIEPEVTAEGLR